MKNAIVMFPHPQWIADPAQAEPALRAAKEAGFGLIVTFPWHMTNTVDSDFIRNAAKHHADFCHAIGLKYYLDFDWGKGWAMPYVEQNPAMAMWHTCRGEGICCDGHFSVDVLWPRKTSHLEDIAEISAVFAKDAAGNVRLLTPQDYSCTQQTLSPIRRQPSYDDDCDYDYFRPFGRQSIRRLSGRTDPVWKQLVVYMSFRLYRWPDVSHPAFSEVQSRLLESYKDVPLDGVGLDEPGKGGTFKSYKTGEGFFEFFKNRNGYEFRTRLIDLDEGCSARALQTRRDYYATLNEMHFSSQRDFNEQARRLFGKEIVLGTHHTFSGIVNDIRCGCCDYFKLGANLTYAFTDTGWDITVPGETTHNYALAEGLRKELAKPGAYCMDWSYNQRTKWYEYYTRLKLLYRLNWISIGLGDGCNEGFPTVPDDTRWKDYVNAVQTLDRVNEFIGDEYETECTTAVWHGWEGIAALPANLNFFSRLLQTCQINLAQTALENGLFYDYVSTSAIEKATTHADAIEINGQRYQRLVIPYPVVVGDAMWKTIKAASAAKIPVVFIGPPVGWNNDSGDNLSAEFADLAGMTAVTLKEYADYYLSRKPRPALDACEPVRVDFTYPVTPKAGTRVHRNVEGEITSIENPATATVYACGADPRQNMVRHLGEFHRRNIPLTHRGNALKRLMWHKTDGSAILVLIARMDSELDEMLTVDGQTRTICRGNWIVLKFAGNRIVDTLKDAPVTIS